MSLKKYICNILFPIEKLTHQLEEHIGPAAYYINIFYLADRAVELILYGVPLGDPMYMERYLESISIPSEKRERMASEFHKEIQNTIQRAIIDYKPSHSYDYQLTELGDVVITDLGIAVKNTSEIETFETIQASIDNGDYVPERMRRMVG